MVYLAELLVSSQGGSKLSESCSKCASRTQTQTLRWRCICRVSHSGKRQHCVLDVLGGALSCWNTKAQPGITCMSVTVASKQESCRVFVAQAFFVAGLSFWTRLILRPAFTLRRYAIVSCTPETTTIHFIIQAFRCYFAELLFTAANKLLQVHIRIIKRLTLL